MEKDNKNRQDNKGGNKEQNKNNTHKDVEKKANPSKEGTSANKQNTSQTKSNKNSKETKPSAPTTFLGKVKKHWIITSILVVGLLLLVSGLVTWANFNSTIKSAKTGPQAAKQVKKEIVSNKALPQKAKQYLEGAKTTWDDKNKSINVTLTPENDQKVQQTLEEHKDLANAPETDKVAKVQKYVASQNHLYDNIQLIDPNTNKPIIAIKDGKVVQFDNNVNPDEIAKQADKIKQEQQSNQTSQNNGQPNNNQSNNNQPSDNANKPN